MAPQIAISDCAVVRSQTARVSSDTPGAVRTIRGRSPRATDIASPHQSEAARPRSQSDAAQTVKPAVAHHLRLGSWLAPTLAHFGSRVTCGVARPVMKMLHSCKCDVCSSERASHGVGQCDSAASLVEG